MTEVSQSTSPTPGAANGFLSDYLRFDKESLFCFFDFETEGLNLFYSRPWQMGLMMVKGDDIVERNNVYIHWRDLKISAEAARITGYNGDKVKRLGWTPEKALHLFEERVAEADYVVGQNVIFYDNYIYRGWCRRLGRRPIDLTPKMLDTFLFAKAIKTGVKFQTEGDRFAFFMKLYSEIHRRLGCSLPVLAKEAGFVVDESRTHDADYDLEMNVFVFNKQKWNIPV